MGFLTRTKQVSAPVVLKSENAETLKVAPITVKPDMQVKGKKETKGTVIEKKEDTKKGESPAKTDLKPVETKKILTWGKSQTSSKKEEQQVELTSTLDKSKGALKAGAKAEKGKSTRARTKSSQPTPSSARPLKSASLSKKPQTAPHARSKSEATGQKEKPSQSLVLEISPPIKAKLEPKESVSLIPTPNGKATTGQATKKLEQTLQQMGSLKVKIKNELQTKSTSNRSGQADKNIEQDLSVDFKDENAVKSFIAELQIANGALKKQVADFNSQNMYLQNRLLKEQEKGKLHPKVTSVVPTSLEANMHLRFQFQQNIDKERKKYSKLLLENEKLALELKEANLDNIRKRKVAGIEVSSAHANEIANWKARVRELELDNLQLLEIITKREQALAKVVKEKEYIYNEMVTMRRLHMHLSNRIDNMASGSLEDPPVEQSTSQANPEEKKDKEVPHYAQKVHRDYEIKLRKGNKKLLALGEKSNAPKSAKAQPFSKTPKVSENQQPLNSNTPVKSLVREDKDFKATGQDKPLLEGKDNPIKSTPVVPPTGKDAVDQKPKQPLLTVMGKENPIKPSPSTEAKEQKPSIAKDHPTKVAETHKQTGMSGISNKENIPHDSPSKPTTKNEEPIQSEAIRSAKIQMEYNAYVKDDKQ